MAQDFTQGGSAHIPYDAGRGFGILAKTIDFSKTPATAAEVLQAIKIPDKCFVLRPFAILHRPEGSAGNVDFGDGSDTDGWLVDFSINGAVGSSASPNPTPVEGTPNTFLGYSLGKYYSAGDTLDVIPSIDLDYAILTVGVIVFDLNIDLPVPA